MIDRAKLVFYNPHAKASSFDDVPREFPNLEMLVPRDEDALAAALPGAGILVTSNRVYEARVAAIVRDSGVDLRWIQFTTSGIDKAIANGLPKDVIVTNVAGLRAFAVAEHAFSLMLGLARRIRQTECARASGHWSRADVTPSLGNLAGQRLVVVGLGAIGANLARKARAFDMHVDGVSRRAGPIEPFDRIWPRERLAEAAETADFLVVTAAYDADSDRLVSRAVIDALPRTARLVNVARGKLVDQAALVEALREQRLAGAGLDVLEEEPLPADDALWSMENVLLTPHIAGAGGEGVATHASMLANNLRRWFAGNELANIVLRTTI